MNPQTLSKKTRQHRAHEGQRVYSREAFRQILSRQTEWQVRAALEEGNIPSCHTQEALEWLEEKAAEFARGRQETQH